MRDVWLDFYVTETLDAQIHRDGVFDMKPVEWVAWVALAIGMILIYPFCKLGWCE